MKDFSGRTAFITGGAQGIGLGIARRLAREGANLALIDIDVDALKRALSELEGQTKVRTEVLDVRDREAFARVADAVEAGLGPVSLLFNNAGVAGAISIHKMNYAAWDWVLGVNLQGVVNGIQTFLPRMLKRGAGGHIVNTASGAGLLPAGSGFLYATSKFAVVGMSESLHVELKQARTNIGLSVVSRPRQYGHCRPVDGGDARLCCSDRPCGHQADGSRQGFSRKRRQHRRGRRNGAARHPGGCALHLDRPPG